MIVYSTISSFLTRGFLVVFLDAPVVFLEDDDFLVVLFLDPGFLPRFLGAGFDSTDDEVVSSGDNNKVIKSSFIICHLLNFPKLNFSLNENVILNNYDKEIIEAINTYPNKISSLLEKTEFREAYKTVMEFATIGNGYLEKVAPWTMIKNEDIDGARKVLYLCLAMAKSLCIVAHPFIPSKTEEIWKEQLNFDGNLNDKGFWNESSKIDIKATHTTNAPKPLFARIDDEKLEEYKLHFSKKFDLFSLKED